MSTGNGLLDRREYSAVQKLLCQTSVVVFIPITSNHLAMKSFLVL